MYDAFREAGGNFIDTANTYTNGSRESNTSPGKGRDSQLRNSTALSRSETYYGELQGIRCKVRGTFMRRRHDQTETIAFFDKVIADYQINIQFNAEVFGMQGVNQGRRNSFSS